MKQRIAGIDYLRAFMSVGVVAWHMQLFGASAIFDQERYTLHVFEISDLLNFHVLLLAVPTFILISCYLHAAKKADFKYWQKQIGRLILLSIFWTIAFTIWNKGGIGLFSLVPRTLSNFLFIVLASGGTVYYFFVSLAIAITATHISSKLSTILNSIFLAISSLAIFLLPRVTMELRFAPLSTYWSPLNFIPYAFAGVLLSRIGPQLLRTRKRLIVCVMLLVGLGVLFSVYEWHFYVQEIFFESQGGYALPAYTRLSLLLFSLAILIIFLSPGIPPHRIVDFMARRSLSLYCLHPFALGGIAGLVGYLHLPYYFEKPLQFAIVISCCYILFAILSLFLKEELLLGRTPVAHNTSGIG